MSPLEPSRIELESVPPLLTTLSLVFPRIMDAIKPGDTDADFAAIFANAVAAGPPATE